MMASNQQNAHKMRRMAHGASTSASAAVKELLPGSNIWMTPPEHPFGNHLQSSAFLLVSDHNILMYGSSHVESLFPTIVKHGGLELQLLNHRDEAAPTAKLVEETFGAPLCAHSLESAAVEAKIGMKVGKELFGGEDEGGDGVLELFDGLKAIHAPGHTRGATAFLYDNAWDGKSYLFAGDSLFTPKPDTLGYSLAIHPNDSNLSDFKATLTRLQSLHPDVIVPSLSACGQFAVEHVSRAHFDPLVDAIEKGKKVVMG